MGETNVGNIRLTPNEMKQYLIDTLANTIKDSKRNWNVVKPLEVLKKGMTNIILKFEEVDNHCVFTLTTILDGINVVGCTELIKMDKKDLYYFPDIYIYGCEAYQKANEILQLEI